MTKMIPLALEGKENYRESNGELSQKVILYMHSRQSLYKYILSHSFCDRVVPSPSVGSATNSNNTYT